MDLTLEKLTPFLRPNPLPSKKATLVRAWAPVLAVLLNNRYGQLITTGDSGNEVVFVSAAADAIQRRLDKPNSMVSAQSVNGASVSYHGSLLAWFSKGEVAQLDALAGVGGMRTYRTPSPDAIRFGNVASEMPEGSSGF